MMRLVIAFAVLLAGISLGQADPLDTNKLACLTITDWNDLGFPKGLPIMSMDQKQKTGRCFQLYKGLDMFRGISIDFDEGNDGIVSFVCMSSATVQRGKCLYVFEWRSK